MAACPEHERFPYVLGTTPRVGSLRPPAAQVPVDKVVEKIVEVPVERVVYVDKVPPPPRAGTRPLRRMDATACATDASACPARRDASP